MGKRIEKSKCSEPEVRFPNNRKGFSVVGTPSLLGSLSIAEIIKSL
jgi:hypothetical protein